MKLFFTIFGTVFLAEMGDKTQIATFLFASKNNINRFYVFLASASALVAASAISVGLGDFLSKFISPQVFKIAGGILFIFLGVLMILGV